MIHANDISMSFNEKPVFQNLNFQVKAGEILVIRGSNGVGKSTLLKVCSGSVKPTSGSIYINDQNLSLSRPKCQKIMSVLIDDILIDKLSGLEYLELVGRLLKIDHKSLKDDLLKWLEFFEVEDPHLWIENYSEGTKQKIRLISALLKKPKVLILDEPCSHLDESIKIKFYHLIINMIKDKTAILLATHDTIWEECKTITLKKLL